jgi:hypothetical protein
MPHLTAPELRRIKIDEDRPKTDKDNCRGAAQAARGEKTEDANLADAGAGSAHCY